MKQGWAQIATTMFGRWAEAVHRAALPILLLSVALAALGSWYCARNLTIDTDTDDMLSAELGFRQDSLRIKRSFPQLSDNIAIVIDGATVDQAEDAALTLAEFLRSRPQLFRHVFYPQGEPFLRRNGLLFLEESELVDLVDRLAGAQAFLGTLWRDPSLRGLFEVLARALEGTSDAAPPAELTRVLDAVSAAAEAEAAGQPGVVSWYALMQGDEITQSDRRRIITVQPRLDYGSLQPASDAMDAIRAAAARLGLVPENGVSVRLTGSAPLEQEELESVAEGMGIAGALSFVLVAVLLLWGLRSVRLALATVATLVIGLIWTASFAALAIGSLNLISVAFAVLFIGLSVDFGIHFALRLREETVEGRTTADAMAGAVSSVGGSLTLVAIAAAIGFLSFLPTAYVGLAELGIIAAAGMFVALFANLTVLPAILSIVPPRPIRRPAAPPGESAPAASWRRRHAKWVVGGAAMLAVGAAALLPAARFDFDPLNLKDRSTESVQTLFDLMGSDETAPYTADVLAESAAEAGRLTQRLEALPTVESVLSIEDFVPENQDEKLAAIESAAFLLLPAFQQQRLAPPSDAQRRQAFVEFRDVLAAYRPGAQSAGTGLDAAVRRLAAALGQLEPGAEVLSSLERRLLSTLPGRLSSLRESLEAGPVTLADLPDALKRRFIDDQGRTRLEVFPRENVRDPEKLRHFAAEVRSVAPRATGSPVIIVEAGAAVVHAFAVAASITVAAIGALVVVLLRRPRDVLLIFAPLVLSALLTVASSVVLDLPFNFANVIVLPLLFGLGVASAIHLVIRERREADLDRLMRSSTPRAVVFSALTTIGSFASLALSSHPGTASMGVLLTLAIGLTLVCTLVVLPSLMALFPARRDDRG